MKDKHDPHTRQKLFRQLIEYFKEKKRFASLANSQPTIFSHWIRGISTSNEHEKYRCIRQQQVMPAQEKDRDRERVMLPVTPSKFSFVELRDRIQFDNVILASIADVNLIVVYKIQEGDPVKRWQAEEVLKALTEMSGIHYTLDTVDIVLYPE